MINRTQEHSFTSSFYPLKLSNFKEFSYMLNNQTTLLYSAKDLGQDKKQADIKEMEIKDF